MTSPHIDELPALSEATARELRGELVLPGDAAYDEARSVWNGMIDRRPAAVVEVVTAAGEVVRASQAENRDLFWGLRGGGGNFGVATEFEFRLHPAGPLLTAGLLLWPRAQAGEVIRFYRDYMAGAPDEVGGAAAFLTAPPAPFVPPDLQGQPVVAVVYCYVGPLDDGEEHARALRAFGSPAVDMIGPMPYTALQGMLDPGFPHGVREYFKIDSLRSLPDESIDTLVAVAGELPAPFGELILCPLGGAVSRSAAAGIALTVAGTPWLYFLPVDVDGPRRGRAQHRLGPPARGVDNRHRAGTAAANFIAEDEAGRLRASYGQEKYARLAELKRRWDPDNLLRLNQNIKPA